MALALVRLEASKAFDWRDFPEQFVVALAPLRNDPAGVIVDLRRDVTQAALDPDDYLVLCSLPVLVEACGSADRLSSGLASCTLDAPLLREELDRFIARAQEESLDLFARRELRLRGSLLIAMASEYSPTSATGPAGWRQRQALGRLTGYIDAHLADSLKVEDLCRASGLTTAQLSRLFSLYQGETAVAYVLNRRLTVARTLVEQQHASLVEVAYLTGFSSQAHFTAAFKAKWGTTPGRVQKRPTASSVNSGGLPEDSKLHA